MRWLKLLAPLVIVIVLIGGIGLWYLGDQVHRITSSIDEGLITDDQRDFIDRMASEPDCDQLRAWLAEAQAFLVSPEPLREPFMERVAEGAERQLDTMRCGG